MLKKSEVIEAFKDLPEEVSEDALKERIDFLASIERGLAQALRGEGTPHEQFMREFDEWRRSLQPK